jgi:hypothetical protein
MRFLKKATETMERRQFLINGGKVLLVLPAGWVLANCSNTTSSPAPSTNVGTGTLMFTSSITEGHNHTFSMTVQEIDSPPSGGISRDTSTTLNHMHVVTLTAAQMDQIAAGQVVTMDTSLVQNHLHTFAFSLAAGGAGGAGGSTAGSTGSAGGGGAGGHGGTGGTTTTTTGSNPTGY